MAEAVRDRIGAFKGFGFTPDEYREVGGERVLVLGHASGRGRASGIDVARLRSEGAYLLHIRDGKVTRMVRYFDRDRALADVGLAPQGDSS